MKYFLLSRKLEMFSVLSFPDVSLNISRNIPMLWVYENVIEFVREDICRIQYAKVKRYRISFYAIQLRNIYEYLSIYIAISLTS